MVTGADNLAMTRTRVVKSAARPRLGVMDDNWFMLLCDAGHLK